MSLNNSNRQGRTPFDNSLLHDPDAPRDTQPLPAHTPAGARPVRPSRLLPPQAANAGQAANSANPSTPVVAANQDDNDTGALSGPLQPSMMKRVPLSAIIGLSMVGGALAVVFISGAVRRAVPDPEIVNTRTARTTTTAPPAVIIEPPADAQVTQPSATTVPGATNGEVTPPETTGTYPSESIQERVTNSDSRREDATPDRTEADTSVSARSSDRTRPDEGSPSATTDNPDSTTERSERRADRRYNTQGNSTAETRRIEREVVVRTDRAASSSGRNVHQGSGYAIAPPQEFKLIQSGRRTIWRGPSGANLLVETTSSPGRSAYGDWLDLDSKFRKKYGLRYRSNGIKETTLAGRPAAVWEFELDTAKGTSRKIDIAVHANGRGYAVLGSAPLHKFDELRPRLEEAIRSFELRDTGGRSTTRRSKRSERRSRDNDEDRNEKDDSNYKSRYPDDAKEEIRPDIGY